MKTIGILGGTSWPSTMEYYAFLNKGISEKKGGFHACPLILYSIDYHTIKSLYGTPDAWEKIPLLLKDELDKLLSCPIDGIIIANHTLHKALDILIQKGLWQTNKPIFHSLELSANEAFQNKYRSILLLGTKFTMQDDFFKRYFVDKGIKVIVPSDNHQGEIQKLQTAVAGGANPVLLKDEFHTILQQYNLAVDAVVLGCTELPLLIDTQRPIKPIINPSLLQCQLSVEFVLSDAVV